jgi:excisionase family DNA binding protein
MRKAAYSPTRRAVRLKQAATYLSVSPRQVRTLVQSGELPLIRLFENDHSPWLLDLKDLDALIERRKSQL